MFPFLNSELIFFSFKVGQRKKKNEKKSPYAAATFPGVNSGNTRCGLSFVAEELFSFLAVSKYVQTGFPWLGNASRASEKPPKPT